MRAIILVLAAGCAADAADPDALFLPPRDSTSQQTCIMTLLSPLPNGDCLAQWSCNGIGLRTLSCGMLQTGPGCVCAQDEVDPTTISMTPTTCDLAGVRQFGTAQCGWGGL